MKRILFLSAMLIIASASCRTAKAQKLSMGVHAGVNMSGFAGGDVYRIYDKSMKAGFEVGGDLRYTFGGKISIMSGLSLMMTGGKFAVMSEYLGVDGQGFTAFPEVNVKTLSVEMPVKVGYDITLAGNWTLMPFAGFYARCALCPIKDKVRAYGEKDGADWNCFEDCIRGAQRMDAFKRFDAGLTVGIESRICRHYALSLNCRRGLTDLSSQYVMKGQSITLALGYVW